MSRAALVREAAASKAMFALGSEYYRITLMKDKRGINLTKDPKTGEETLLSHRQVLAMLPQLAAKNAQGWNIFITPISEQAHYLVVDDLNGQAGLRELRELGHEPALVQESSPGNYQAVLKVKKTEGPLERKAANKVVRALNLEIGDPEFTGAVHPFRLAGLANRKPKHEFAPGMYPYVKVIEAPGNYDGLATRQVEDNVIVLQVERAKRASVPGRDFQAASIGELPAVDPVVATAEREARSKLERWVALRGWDRNASRIDFGVAKTLLEQGYKPGAVAAALHVGSPALEDRHPNVVDYLDRTVRAADDRIQADLAKRATPARDIDHDIDI